MRKNFYSRLSLPRSPAPRLFARTTVVLFSVVFSASLLAEEFAVGSRGAALVAGPGWRHETFYPRLGGDQFVHESGVLAVFVETTSLLERRTDFESALDSTLEAIESEMTSVTSVGDPRYRYEDGVGHYRHRMAGTRNGISLGYQLDLVSRDCLGYLMISWANHLQSSELHEFASGLVEGLRFPGPDTEWGQKASRSEATFRLQDWKISLTFRPSVFSVVPAQDGERISLMGGEQDVAVHLFLEEFERDLDGVVDAVVAAVSDDEELDELNRSPFQHPEGEAVEVLLRNETEGDEFDIAVAVIQVADSLFADVRMVSVGRGGHREGLWRDLLFSLRAIPPPRLDAYPTVEENLQGMQTSIHQAARALLETADLVGSTGWATQRIMAANGDVVVRESNRVVKLSAAAEPAVLYSSDEYLSGSVAYDGREVLLMDQDQRVFRIQERAVEELEFSARHMAALDGRWLLVRTPRAPSLLGFSQLPDPGPAQVILRSRTGGESVVAEVEATITVLATSRNARRALVAASPRPGLDSMAGRDRASLLEVSLAQGSIRELEGWKTIVHLAGAADGWLVSGTPVNATPGVYALTEKGDRELLVSGNVVGLGLEDDALTFATDLCLKPASASTNCIYRAPLSAVRAHGPRFSPFTATVLNRIAADLARGRGGEGGDGLYPATAEGVNTLVREANAVSARWLGVALPGEPATVDRLLADLSGSRELSDEALALLAALLADTLLHQDAVWLPGPNFEPASRSSGNGWESESSLAVALRPLQVLVSALYHEDGWWRPVQSLLDQAKGRTLLLSHDRQALEEEMDRRRLPGTMNLIRNNRAAKLANLLNRHPTNVYLRHRVYRHLAALGHLQTLERLAGPFVEGGTPAIEDLQPWLAARLGRATSDVDIEGFITSAREAIAHHPDQASLYLLLGSAYERTARPQRVEYALACYRKVVELTPWGHLGTAAQAAMDRIDKAD